eukprot:10938194-Lingulodinium_polyedra.AAC.1
MHVAALEATPPSGSGTVSRAMVSDFFVQAWSLPPDLLVCSSFQEFQPLAAEALASFTPKASILAAWPLRAPRRPHAPLQCRFCTSAKVMLTNPRIFA